MTYVIKIADDDNFLEDYKRIHGNNYPISKKLLFPQDPLLNSRLGFR